jgi:ADP-ribose pyrophosphatase YjhB (NUDIX family)
LRLPPPLFKAAHYLYRAKWWLLRPITTGVRVMVLNGDQVLLIRHTYQGGWFMPGGGLKRNETLEEAARRELREETGLTVGRMDVAGVFTNVFEGKTDHVVLFRTETDAQPVPDSPEVAECRWFPISALPEGLGRGSRQRIIELARPGAPVVAGRW